MNSEMYDYLTGLYNRKGMYEMWKTILGEEDYVQVLFLDLDNFKTVNDMFGHKAGDETLVQIGRIMRGVVGDSGFLIRLAGDEFIIMIPGETSRDSLKALAEDMMEQVRHRARVDRTFEIISISIGIVWNARVEDNLDSLLSNSDAALYFAKEMGKNQYIFYDDFSDKIHLDYEMESSAEDALEAGRFKLLYQPVMHLQNGKLLRTEAVTIWESKDGRIWTRDEFEHVLEKSSFITRVDLFVFERLCQNYLRLNEGDGWKSVISINVSNLLLEEKITSILIEQIHRYQVPIDQIELLVNEKMFSKRSVERLVRNLNSLKEAGFQLGITNFGGDFSSFRYLSTLPVTTIFFDKDYIKANLEDESRRNILHTLFHLTKDMHFLSIGLGVDSADEVIHIMENGCEGATGSFYSEPLPLEKYREFVSNIEERDNLQIYDFKNRLSTIRNEYKGKIIGGGVQYVSGISDEWGGLRFSGGAVETNLVQLPKSLFVGGSFTVMMWLKPKEVQNWISAFFIRQQKGFISFMPSISGNQCMFRTHPDGDDVVWTDVMVSALPIGKWSHVAFVYDAFSSTIRLYVDGVFAGMHTDIVDLGSSSMVYLGGDCYQNSYQGDISALCIYDTPRTEEEIRQSYLNYKKEPNFHGDEEAEGRADYMVHDPAVYEDLVTHQFYLYCTGAQGMVSKDLEHWTNLGTIVEGVPEEAKAWTKSDAIWAPDIVKVGDEYRLYCSNSSWGVQQSCIFLATSDQAEGPFIPQKPVLKTDDTLIVNGIDANIIEDHETQEQYMLYGSFWGGIRMLPLDRKTGYARNAGADGSGVGSLRLSPKYKQGMTIMDLPEEEQVERMGICLARRPLWTSGSIEGPYMIYHPESKYYYLFVSYGSLKSDYNIRIGRSRKITGPFLDYDGNDLADPKDDSCARGLMISAGYRWLTGMPYMGPGHNSVLLREDGDMFLVSHIRKMQFLQDDPGAGLLQIRRLFLTPDGWLIAGAQPYANETLRIARDPVIPGTYERIELRPSIPQGIAHAHPLKLFEDGRLECCSIGGTWRRVNEFTLEFVYGPIREFVHIEKGLDVDINKTTILLSGLTSQGICTWAKKKID